METKKSFRVKPHSNLDLSYLTLLAIHMIFSWLDLRFFTNAKVIHYCINTYTIVQHCLVLVVYLVLKNPMHFAI